MPNTIDLLNIRTAVILPAYNEELTIRQTIVDFSRTFPSAHIWVVDNRSSDATAEIARDALISCKASGGILYESRPGKGNAVRKAFREVDADFYVLADADSTYSGADGLSLLNAAAQHGADLVVGDRHSAGHYSVENKRAFHGFGNSLVRSLVNHLFGANLTDILSGLRVLSRRFVKTYPILVDGFEIETDMTLHALDKRIKIFEVPISYRDRPSGSISKLNTFQDGFRVIGTILHILRYYRPLYFFTLLSAVFFVLGLLAAVPVFDDWISNQYIYHLPLAVLATGLELVSVLLLIVGLILDSIAKAERQRFEREYLRFPLIDR